MAQLSMLDRPLMVWVNLAVAEYNYPKSNKFVTGAKIKATGESKLNESPNNYCF